MSGSALSEATARCLVRRARRGARAAPMVAIAVAVALVAAPVLLVRGGVALGGVVSPLLAEPTAARVVLGTVVAFSAIGGASLTLLLPDRSSVGPEAAAAPIPSRRLLAAIWLAPLTLVLATAAPFGLCLLLPLAASSPGGWAAAPALVVAGLAGVLGGAAVGEAARLARRRDRVPIPMVAGLSGLWLAIGATAGTPVAGPLARGADAFAGGSTGRSIVEFAALAVAAAACWVVAAPRHRGRRTARRRRALPSVRGGPSVAPALAALALVTRRSDVRIVAATAALAGLGTLAIGYAIEAPGSLAALAALFTVALASAPVAVAAPGIALAGRRVWRSTPVGLVRLTVTWCGAGCVALLAIVAAVSMPLVATRQLPVSALGSTASSAASTAALALVAGALVPWRAGGVGEQLPTIAALAVTLAVGGVLAVELGAFLQDLRLPEVAATVATTGCAVVLAAIAVAARLSRSA